MQGILFVLLRVIQILYPVIRFDLLFPYQVIQTMQIPLSYAEDIIGVHGTNIDYIRRTSGAILTVQESRVPDEIIVEIKGTSSEVQTAQQLIQVETWAYEKVTFFLLLFCLRVYVRKNRLSSHFC